MNFQFGLIMIIARGSIQRIRHLWDLKNLGKVRASLSGINDSHKTKEATQGQRSPLKLFRKSSINQNIKQNAYPKSIVELCQALLTSIYQKSTNQSSFLRQLNSELTPSRRYTAAQLSSLEDISININFQLVAEMSLEQIMELAIFYQRLIDQSITLFDMHFEENLYEIIFDKLNKVSRFLEPQKQIEYYIILAKMEDYQHNFRNIVGEKILKSLQTKIEGKQLSVNKMLLLLEGFRTRSKLSSEEKSILISLYKDISIRFKVISSSEKISLLLKIFEIDSTYRFNLVIQDEATLFERLVAEIKTKQIDIWKHQLHRFTKLEMHFHSIYKKTALCIIEVMFGDLGENGELLCHEQQEQMIKLIINFSTYMKEEDFMKIDRRKIDKFLFKKRVQVQKFQEVMGALIQNQFFSLNRLKIFFSKKQQIKSANFLFLLTNCGIIITEKLLVQYARNLTEPQSEAEKWKYYQNIVYFMLSLQRYLLDQKLVILKQILKDYYQILKKEAQGEQYQQLLYFFYKIKPKLQDQIYSLLNLQEIMLIFTSRLEEESSFREIFIIQYLLVKLVRSYQLPDLTSMITKSKFMNMFIRKELSINPSNYFLSVRIFSIMDNYLASILDQKTYLLPITRVNLHLIVQYLQNSFYLIKRNFHQYCQGEVMYQFWECAAHLVRDMNKININVFLREKIYQMVQIFIADRSHSITSTIGFSHFLRTIVFISKFSKSNVKMKSLIPAFYKGLIAPAEIKKIVNLEQMKYYKRFHPKFYEILNAIRKPQASSCQETVSLLAYFMNSARVPMNLQEKNYFIHKIRQYNHQDFEEVCELIRFNHYRSENKGQFDDLDVELISKFTILWNFKSIERVALTVADTIEAIHRQMKNIQKKERQKFIQKINAWYTKIFEQFYQRYDNISIEQHCKIAVLQRQFGLTNLNYLQKLFKSSIKNENSQIRLLIIKTLIKVQYIFTASNIEFMATNMFPQFRSSGIFLFLQLENLFSKEQISHIVKFIFQRTDHPQNMKEKWNSSFMMHNYLKKHYNLYYLGSYFSYQYNSKDKSAVNDWFLKEGQTKLFKFVVCCLSQNLKLQIKFTQAHRYIQLQLKQKMVYVFILKMGIYDKSDLNLIRKLGAASVNTQENNVVLLEEEDVNKQCLIKEINLRMQSNEFKDSFI